VSRQGPFRSAALFAFHLLFVRPMLRLLVGVRYRRKSLIPPGPCLVVANHNSHLDAPVLLSLFPLRRIRRVHPVAAADYFGETWLLRTLSMVLMNAVPIQRNPEKGQDPLAHVVEAFDAGDSIILFPEGTRGEAGVVAPFRSGVGRLVRARPSIPVVPVFLSGPERIWPRGEAVPVPLGIDVHVGRPRTFDASKESRAIAEEIRDDVLALAPPLAPVPGPRPKQSAVVAVCGGDPEERRELTLALARRFARDHESGALALTDRHWVIHDDGVTEPGSRLPRRRGWHGKLAQLAGARAPLAGAAFAELVRRTRAERETLQDPEHRTAVLDGSALVDLLAAEPRSLADDRAAFQRIVFAEAQRRVRFADWRSALREDPEIWLLNGLGLARMRSPDLLVLLEPGPELKRVAEVLRKTRKTAVLEPAAGATVASVAEAAASSLRCAAALSATAPSAENADST